MFLGTGPLSSVFNCSIKNVSVKKKFEQREYRGIDEFVTDFRTMLQNCYRYNGPDHPISKKAQRLETMLEQKLSLLSRYVLN